MFVWSGHRQSVSCAESITQTQRGGAFRGLGTLLHKYERYGRAEVVLSTGRRKLSGVLIHAKNGYSVRVLISDYQEIPARIEGKTPRCFPASALILNQGGLAGFRIQRENGDGVKTPVGRVQELAARVHFDLRPGTLSIEIGGESGGHVDFFHRRSGGIVREGGHRGSHLVERINMLLIWGECHVARSRTG